MKKQTKKELMAISIIDGIMIEYAAILIIRAYYYLFFDELNQQNNTLR